MEGRGHFVEVGIAKYWLPASGRIGFLFPEDWLPACEVLVSCSWSIGFLGCKCPGYLIYATCCYLCLLVKNRVSSFFTTQEVEMITPVMVVTPSSVQVQSLSPGVSFVGGIPIELKTSQEMWAGSPYLLHFALVVR